jgi:hypothetical protein
MYQSQEKYIFMYRYQSQENIFSCTKPRKNNFHVPKAKTFCQLMEKYIDMYQQIVMKDMCLGQPKSSLHSSKKL